LFRVKTVTKALDFQQKAKFRHKKLGLKKTNKYLFSWVNIFAQLVRYRYVVSLLSGTSGISCCVQGCGAGTQISGSDSSSRHL